MDEVQRQLEQISSGLSGLVSADLFIKTPRELPYLENLIADAKEVCFVGRSLNGLVSGHRTLLLRLAKQECKFKFLIGDPTGRDLEQIKSDVQHTISQLAQMAKEIPNRIEFRIAQRRLHYGAILIDRKSKVGSIQIELYTYWNPEQERPHLILDATRDPMWYQFYSEQFENMWQQGTVPSNAFDNQNAG